MKIPLIFCENDLPGPHHGRGFSVYKNVLIEWDGDRDARILSVLDAIPKFLRHLIAVVQEHEGIIRIVWYPGGRNLYKQWTGRGTVRFPGRDGIRLLNVGFYDSRVDIAEDSWNIEHRIIDEGKEE